MAQAQLYPLVAYKQQYPISKEHVLPWGLLIAFQKYKVISLAVCWITKVCKIIPVMRNNTSLKQAAKSVQKSWF